MKVRDKFWIFACRAHDDDVFLADCPNEHFGEWSRITPTEGAMMLGVDNMIMVSSDGIPVPYSVDAYGYMESFCNMKNVWWSATGSSGCRAGNEENFIVDLAEKYPNVTGAFFDDLLCSNREPEVCKKIIDDVSKTLKKACRPIEMWATCYVDKAEKYSDPKIYENLDGITIWHLDVDTIPDIDNYLETYEKLLPNKRKMLGIYISLS